MSEPWCLAVPIVGAEAGRADLPSLDHVTPPMREALLAAEAAHAEAEAEARAEDACGHGSGPERREYEIRTREARGRASRAFVAAQETANAEAYRWAELLALRYNAAVLRFDLARAELAAAAREAVVCARLRRTARQAPYRLATRHGEPVGAVTLQLAVAPLKSVTAPGIDE